MKKTTIFNPAGMPAMNSKELAFAFEKIGETIINPEIICDVFFGMQKAKKPTSGTGVKVIYQNNGDWFEFHFDKNMNLYCIRDESQVIDACKNVKMTIDQFIDRCAICGLHLNFKHISYFPEIITEQLNNVPEYYSK